MMEFSDLLTLLQNIAYIRLNTIWNKLFFSIKFHSWIVVNLYILCNHQVYQDGVSLLYAVERQRIAYKIHGSFVLRNSECKCDSFPTDNAICIHRRLDISSHNEPMCEITVQIIYYVKPCSKHFDKIIRRWPITSMNLPNRELLLFRVVFALPNASKIGLASRILRSIGPAAANEWHRYLRIYFVLSVLPAPLSPDTIIDCDTFNTRISRIALSATK